MADTFLQHLMEYFKIDDETSGRVSGARDVSGTFPGISWTRNISGKLLGTIISPEIFLEHLWKRELCSKHFPFPFLQTIIITTTVVTCVCSIFFEFVGIIGALKESGTLLGVYKVGAIGELALRAVYTYYDGNFGGLLIWEIVLLAVTAVYGYDLLRIQRMNRRRSRSRSVVDGWPELPRGCWENFWTLEGRIIKGNCSFFRFFS